MDCGGGKGTRLKEKRGQLVGFQRSMLVDKDVQKDQRKGIRDEMDDFARSSAGAGNPVLGDSKQTKLRKTKEEKEEEKREARN